MGHFTNQITFEYPFRQQNSRFTDGIHRMLQIALRRGAAKWPVRFLCESGMTRGPRLTQKEKALSPEEREWGGCDEQIKKMSIFAVPNGIVLSYHTDTIEIRRDFPSRQQC